MEAPKQEKVSESLDAAEALGGIPDESADGEQGPKKVAPKAEPVLVESEDFDMSGVTSKPPPRPSVEPTYRGWKEVGRYKEKDALTDEDLVEDLLSHASLFDTYLPAAMYGDWYHNVGFLIGGAALSWFFGWLRFSLAPVFFIMVAFSILYRTSVRKYRSVLREQAQREFAIKSIENDYETMDWINVFLEKFWVFLEPSISQIVCDQANPILAASPAPAFIKALWIDSFTAGTKPPRIDCVKTLSDTDDDVVVMDWGVSFTPNSLSDASTKQLKSKVNQKVLVKATLFGITLPVIVSDVTFKSFVRVRMRMMSSFPHIETINVSLLEPPQFDFSCRLLGDTAFNWEVLNFPGLYPFINEMIKKYVGPVLYAPLSFQLNVQQLMAGNSLDSAIGVLVISAHAARGLKGFNYLGNTLDPYLTFGFQKDVLAKSSIKNNTSQPVWNETYYIPVKSLSDPLKIVVIDYNDIRKDREVGAVQFDLETLRTESKRPNISAPFIRNNKPVGEFQFGIEFMPTLEPQRQVDGAVIPPPDLNTGIARILIEGARNLKTKETAASTYAKLYFNNELSLTTPTQKKTNNPAWGVNDERIVFDRAKAKVKVILHEAKSDKVLGRINLSLNELIDATQVDECWFSLPAGGEMRILTSWKPVGISQVSGAGRYTPPKGVVRVSLDKAEDLRNLETIGKVDPYARVMINGFQRARTVAFDSSLNPTWNEVHYATVSSSNQRLTLEVMDVESHSPDRTLGSFDIKLNDIIQRDEKGAYIEHVDTEKRVSKLIHKKGPKGTLTYSLSFYPTLPVMTLEDIKEEEEEAEAQRKAKEEKKNGKGDKQENGGKVEEKPAEEKEEEEEESDEPKSSKLKLSLDELCQYKSGVIIYEMSDYHVSKDDVYLQVYFDALSHPNYVAPRLTKKQGKVGTTGDGVVKELDESLVCIKVAKGKEDNRLDKALAEITMPTIDFLKKAFHEPFTFNLEGSITASFKMHVSWMPVIYTSAVPPQDKFDNSGNVKIEVIRAENLIAADRSGKSDPYATLHLNTEKKEFFKTKKVKKTLDPTWNESTEVKVANLYDSVIRILCWDWDIGPELDDLIGIGEVPLSEVYNNHGAPVEIECPLRGEDNEDGGKIFLRMSYTPEVVFNINPSGSTLNDAFSQVGRGVGGVGKGVGKGVGGVGKGVGGVGKGVGKVFKKGLGFGKSEED